MLKIVHFIPKNLLKSGLYVMTWLGKWESTTEMDRLLLHPWVEIKEKHI